MDSDNKIMIEITSAVLNSYPNARIYNCESNMHAFKKIIEHSIDLLITEISSKDGNIDGFEVIQQAKVKNNSVETIIVADSQEHAFEAHEYRPFAYHLKPLNKKAFTETLKEVGAKIATKKRSENYLHNRFVVQNRSEYLCIPYNDILYFETHAKKTTIHLENDKIPFTRNLY